MRTCTRRLEFDAAHRVMRHESKCRHLHGHRYVVDVTCAANGLDTLGRVVDFSVIKTEFGTWIDEHLDHGSLLHAEDAELLALCRREGWKHFAMSNGNPTAENIAAMLYEQAGSVLHACGVEVTHVRVYETPNCWADFP